MNLKRAQCPECGVIAFEVPNIDESNHPVNVINDTEALYCLACEFLMTDKKDIAIYLYRPLVMALQTLKNFNVI